MLTRAASHKTFADRRRQLVWPLCVALFCWLSAVHQYAWSAEPTRAATVASAIADLAPIDHDGSPLGGQDVAQDQAEPSTAELEDALKHALHGFYEADCSGARARKGHGVVPTRHLKPLLRPPAVA